MKCEIEQSDTKTKESSIELTTIPLICWAFLAYTLYLGQSFDIFSELDYTDPGH